MIDLVIHVGIRKSATTWLQNMFFPKLPGVNYLGKTNDNYPQWLIEWHYLDDFEFSRRLPDIKATVTGKLIEGAVNVISSEAFSNTAVIWPQAHRIKQMFPEARIIVTLRDPIDTLASHYKLDVAEGRYHLPIDEYLDWVRTPYDIVKRKPIFLPDFFYSEMIDLYRRLFGKSRVCVLRYEDMIGDSRAYVESLTTFFDVANPGSWEELLAKKMNAGASSALTRKERARNMYTYLTSHYPNLAAQIGHDSFLIDIKDEEIISDVLRDRLKNYFSGKCYGYY